MKQIISRTFCFLSLDLLAVARVVLLSLVSLGTLAACSDDSATPSADGGTGRKPSDEETRDAGSKPHTADSDDTDTDMHDSDEAADADDTTATDDSADTHQGSDGGPSSHHPDEPDTSAGGEASDPTDPSDEPEDTSDAPDDPTGPRANAHFFLPTPEIDNTGAPHLVLDKAGGLHAAYPTYVGKGAYYAYCGPGCASKDDVHPVRFETEFTVLNALVAVTDDGRPRILLSAWDRIYYGECDQGCTSQASWNFGAVLKHDNKKEITGEAFALDADGNPAFILHSYVELFGIAQEKPATHFAFCTSNCTSNAGWSANLIAEENWEGSSLRFDDDGRAHVFAAEVSYEGGVPRDRIPVYANCAGNCTDPAAAWRSLSLNYPAYEDRNKAVSMRPALSLELTNDGAPRVLVMLKGEAEDERWVTYMACDEGCTENGDAWSGTVISSNPQLAAGLDLALDFDDRPRVVYNLGYSIFYAACDTGACTEKPEEWAISPVELVAEMAPDTVILWPNCTVDAWFLHSPNLVLDATGNARVGYQAADMSGGGVSNPDPTQTPCNAGLDMTWTRVTTF